MELAKMLEGKEGPGDVQVCYFDCVCHCLYLQTVDCCGYKYSYLFACSYEVVWGWRCCLPEDGYMQREWWSVTIHLFRTVALNLYYDLPFKPTLGLPISCVCHPWCFFVALFPWAHLFLTPYGSLSLSNTSAVALINVLRQGRSETESVQLEHCPIQSHRIVLLAQNERRRSEKSFKASAETNKAPSRIQSTASPSIKSAGWFNSTCSSLLDSTQTCFLDGYTGTRPLIGEHK